MDFHYLFFMVVHGLCVGVLVMMGVYLLTSIRSAYQDEVEPNLLVRRMAGWNVMLWAVTFALTLLEPLFAGTQYEIVVPDLDVMLCMLLVPAACGLLCSLLQMQEVIRRYFWLHLLVPAGLIVWYLFDHQRLMLYLSAGYWSIYSVLFGIWFSRKERKYHRRLMDLYSDMEHHEIRWVYQFLGLFMIYLLLFLVAHVMKLQMIYYVSYAYCIGLWALLIYYVDHYSCTTRFWTGTSEEMAVGSEPEDVPLTLPNDNAYVAEQAGDEAKSGERSREWVGKRLQEQCVDAGLYLHHDLSIDVLAAHLGTNRTYIGRYLASKGWTYYTYINSLRVNYAKRLMDEEPDVNLSDVAFQSGFKSDSTFRRAFSEIEKCTPSEYMKRKGKG